ncbi:hypothetical protein Chor_005464, partial [Crotalus horridus]
MTENPLLSSVIFRLVTLSQLQSEALYQAIECGSQALRKLAWFMMLLAAPSLLTSFCFELLCVSEGSSLRIGSLSLPSSCPLKMRAYEGKEQS